MANVITAGNSSNGGTAITTDTSGTLNIVTGSGSGANAITIDASQNVTVAGTATITGGISGNLSINGNASVISASSTLGYGAGAGGTVTQATNKSTAVTLNKPTGQITMSNAALAAGTSVSFVLNNTLISGADIIIVNTSVTAVDGRSYRVEAINNGAGSATLRVTNITGGSLSEALALNFAVIKGATS